MVAKSLGSKLLEQARTRAGLSQRGLANRAGTAQSVVARIELGEAVPTLTTLERLLRAAGFELQLGMQARPVLDRQLLDDVPRILRLTPEARLREVANLSRFLTAARLTRHSNPHG
jgi:transcriptional regulator with XRE-family HTH domain